MRTHTVFTLRDSSRFDTVNEAKNHCQEMMGAETRTMLYDIAGNGLVQRSALSLVVDKKYDAAILEYVAWREEMNQLEAFEENDRA